jgi:hypothetical protein
VAPAATEADAGLTLIVVNTDGASTVSVTVAVLLIEPDVPVIVIILEPSAAVDPTLNVSVAVAPDEAKPNVTPVGRPEIPTETVPEKPLMAVNVKVLSPLEPCLTVNVLGFTVMVKLGPLVTVTEAPPVTVPLAAVTVNGPPVVFAVKSPVELIVPPPVVVQVNDG